MFEKEAADIQETIAEYFKGIFFGDIPKLKSTFHPQCLLFGDINGQPYFNTINEYLEGVQYRKSPHELGETFKMKILSIELINSIAYAKLHVPMLGYNYHDFISMNKIDGRWMIVNKLFTNISE
ncbi:nuclear transport factor 2 family protein [Flavihumibacter rivuli]|uniref:nuclear transport factor 2 family protein n=1 Tax=Flavihumibacter rivuli TaxID=2838156 RepID=UPI001BDF14F5|nr:nuclear transport factor 2 family protein [Flavihumibacter rivuli]ULQ56914.1 nuclear transport factor 2 family protein [Flavihumibacter rivuli]